MEVAAERIRFAVKNILPERPHHLALSLDRKYPVPPNFWHHHSPLQYTTYISDADRGVLLTRPYFDICDEPELPVATSRSTISIGSWKPGNKVSLKDWKIKKTTESPIENGTRGKIVEKPAPAENGTTGKMMEKPSPTENGTTAKRIEQPSPSKNGTTEKMAEKPSPIEEGSTEKRIEKPSPTKNGTTGKMAEKPSPTENATTGKVVEKQHQESAPRPERDVSRKEQDRTKQAGPYRDTKPPEIRSNGNVEKPKGSVSLPKATTRDASNPSSESRKRPMDNEDSARPHKKTRPSEPQPSALSQKPLRPPTPSNREQARSASKDGRSGAAQSAAPSNRASQSGLKENQTIASAKSTANGTRPKSSASRNPLPTEPDASRKHFVPPLLSPLRQLPFDQDLETVSLKKRPVGGHVSGKSHSRAPRPEVLVKKQRSVLPELPTLLSPTLPPEVEDALVRMNIPSKRNSSHLVSQSSHSPIILRKARPPDATANDTRPSKIVVMRYKKALRKRIQSLLALPSLKERSASVEDTAPATKKRPRPLEFNAELANSAVAKRPRTAAEVSAMKAPQTPPKAPAASKQPAPSSFPIQTPRGRLAQTPRAGDVASAGRESGSQAAKEMFRRRWDDYRKLGKKIKQKRDGEYQANGVGSSGSGQAKRAEVDNRQAILTTEMILAYIIAFRSLNQWSELTGTGMEIGSWLSLEPHLRGLKQMARHSTSLQALAYQLHGVVIQEIVGTYGSMGGQGTEPPKLDSNTSRALFQAMRNYSRIWTEADELRGKVTDKSLKTTAMGPWTTPLRAASDTLTVLARFAAREHVDWRAEVVVPHEGA